MKTDNPYYLYYKRQCGGDFSPVVFHGYKYQRGRGFGSFFSSLFRRVSPFLKTLGADIGKELLNTGSHLIDDAVAGRNLKEAARSRFSSAGKSILNNSLNTLKTQAGFGKRKRKRSKSVTKPNKKRKVSKTKSKKPRKKVYKKKRKAGKNSRSKKRSANNNPFFD